MRKMLYCLIVIFLSGCLPDKLLDTLVLKSQSIINNNDSKMKYLLAYQMSNNVNGAVFQLFYNDNPCFEPTGEYPTKTIKYKDKYMCLIRGSNHLQHIMTFLNAFQIQIQYSHGMIESGTLEFLLMESNVI